MKIIALLTCLLFISAPVFSLPIIIDVGDYKIIADASVSINIQEDIIVMQNNQVITLDQERYNNLVGILEDAYNPKDELQGSGIIIRVTMHPYAMEYFAANRRPEVVAYWESIFDGVDSNDPTQYPSVQPLSPSMLFDDNGVPMQ